MSGKIDAADLIIAILREHEDRMDYYIDRLEQQIECLEKLLEKVKG